MLKVGKSEEFYQNSPKNALPSVVEMDVDKPDPR